MANLDALKQQLNQKGFADAANTRLPKGLLWSPDIVVSKNGAIFPVLFKSNNSIPSTFLNRIAQSATDKFVPLVVFAQKLSTAAESDLVTTGVSYGYWKKGKLTDLRIKQRKSTSALRSEIKQKKLPVMDIFLSSRQNIAERLFVDDRIKNLRRIHRYPWNDPILIEYQNFTPKQLLKYIDKVLKDCEMIVIVLEDTWSKIVAYEMRRALSWLRHEDIFIFAKQTSSCSLAWKKELAKIINLPTQSIKYIRFSENQDLEAVLSMALIRRMNQIYKKKKITAYV